MILNTNTLDRQSDARNTEPGYVPKSEPATSAAMTSALFRLNAAQKYTYATNAGQGTPGKKILNTSAITQKNNAYR